MFRLLGKSDALKRSEEMDAKRAAQKKLLDETKAAADKAKKGPSVDDKDRANIREALRKDLYHINSREADISEKICQLEERNRTQAAYVGTLTVDKLMDRGYDFSEAQYILDQQALELLNLQLQQLSEQRKLVEERFKNLGATDQEESQMKIKAMLNLNMLHATATRDRELNLKDVVNDARTHNQHVKFVHDAVKASKAKEAKGEAKAVPAPKRESNEKQTITGKNWARFTSEIDPHHSPEFGKFAAKQDKRAARRFLGGVDFIDVTKKPVEEGPQQQQSAVKLGK